MDKPAVAFNEQGWRDFLKFVTNIMSARTETGEDAAADALIKAYMNQAAGDPQEPTQSYKRTIKARQYVRQERDYPAEYEALRGIMYGNGPMKLSEIYNAMRELNFWSSDNAQATSRLQDVIKRYNDIVKIGRGLYQMPAEDEIVLKFKEPYFSEGYESGGEQA